MADTDNMQDQEKQGGGFTGVLGGAGVGYLAGSTAGKIFKAPDGIDPATLDKKKGELTAKKDAIVNAGDDELKSLNKDVNEAATLKTNAEAAHTAVQYDAWKEQIELKAKPQDVASLKTAQLEAKLAVINSTPATTEEEKKAQKWAAEMVQKQKTGITEVVKSDTFKGLKEADTAEANRLINEKLGGVWGEATKDAATIPAGALARESAAQVAIEKGGAAAGDLVKKFAGAKTDGKIADAVKNHDLVKPEAGKVEEAAKVLKTAEEKFKPKFDKATDAGAYNTMEKEVGKLTKNVEANAEQNFFKRGAKLAMKGTNGQKAAVILTTLGAAAATYMGIKAIKNRGRSESYVDQINQERAAAPTPDQQAAAR